MLGGVEELARIGPTADRKRGWNVSKDLAGNLAPEAASAAVIAPAQASALGGVQIEGDAVHAVALTAAIRRTVGEDVAQV